MTQKPLKTLTEIFAATDHISYGPFKIVKPIGADYKKAEFTVNGQMVPLKPSEMRVMALLISQQGAYVTISMLGQASGSPTLEKLAQDMDAGKILGRAASFHLNNNFKVAVCKIRKAIEKTLDNPDEAESACRSIRPLKAFSRGGELRRTEIEDESGYRLALII